MTTMLEKVARAMALSPELIDPVDTWVEFGPNCDDAMLKEIVIDGPVDFIALARAALQAIREPTGIPFTDEVVDCEGGWETPRTVWRDTIDAILAEDEA